MIYEYALDPTALRAWNTFKVIAGGLGISHGRLIVRYPKHWKFLAYEALAQVTDQNDKHNLEVWLADRAPRVMAENRSGARWIPGPPETWFANAVRERRSLAVRAIISDQPEASEPPVLNFDDLDEEKALWNVPRQKVVLRRDHREIVAALRPLITHAKKIRFVDPYFSADPDQLNIIAACLSFFPQIPNSRETNVELHVSGEQRAEETVEFIREKLRQILPNGLTPPSIVRWRHDYVHNRFVLTDRGGIQLGDSLRRHDERPDQLTLLEDHAWKFWWNRHDSGIHQSQLAP